MAGLVVAGLALCGVEVYRAVVPGAFCSAPGGEAAVLRAYLAEPVMSTPPRPGGAPAIEGGTVSFCGLVGVDHIRPAHYTAQWVRFQTTGWWPSAALRARYDPVAAHDGWSYVRQADESPAQPGTCFGVAVNGVSYCEGDGVGYCKRVDGVVSFLYVTGHSRGDVPNLAANIHVEIDAQWTTRTCPTTLGGGSPTS